MSAAAGGDSGSLGVAEKVSKLLSNIALIGAAIIAVAEFNDQKANRKIERTIEYIKEFERGTIAEARAKLNSTFRPYMVQFIDLDEGGGVSASDQQDLIAALIEQGDGSVAGAFDRVVDFYEGIRLCIDKGLCDRSTAVRYFSRGRATEFWTNYEPYIDLRRKNNESFAVALESFAGVNPQQGAAETSDP